MEDWVTTKSALIRRLVELSSFLEVQIDLENWDAVEEHLCDRARLLRQLQKMDHQAGTQPSGFDENWMRQLAWIQSREADLSAKLRRHRLDLAKQMAEIKTEKMDVLEEAYLSPKGHSLEIRV